MNATSIADGIGWVGAGLTTFCFAGQVRRSWITKKTEDLDLTMYLMLIDGVVLWMMYGVFKSRDVVLGANIIAFFMVSSILYLILRYSKQIIQARVVIPLVIYFSFAILSRYYPTIYQTMGVKSWEEFIGYMATGLTSTCNLPQVWKILINKKTEDIDIWFYVAFVVGITGWLVHGLLLNDGPIIVANAITLSTSVPVLCLKIWYDVLPKIINKRRIS